MKKVDRWAENKVSENWLLLKWEMTPLLWNVPKWKNDSTTMERMEGSTYVLIMLLLIMSLLIFIFFVFFVWKAFTIRRRLDRRHLHNKASIGRLLQRDCRTTAIDTYFSLIEPPISIFLFFSHPYMYTSLLKPGSEEEVRVSHPRVAAWNENVCFFMFFSSIYFVFVNLHLLDNHQQLK